MSELRDLYQEVILDHAKRPRNFGRPERFDHEAHGHNPLCGDKVDIFVILGEGGTVEDVRFEGRGCAISMASASLMTELLKGKTETEARTLFEHFHEMVTHEAGGDALPDAAPDDLERLEVLAGVRQFPMRVKCATLPWHTFNAALASERADGVTTE
ncbi:MAG: system NifU family Fe-S cluster assembly protein [Rhodospirillales bacterium]|jgi:nitrogen fixation NifU-like protein|nr:system NifU family Fe-S cluster assembly protein [Rhodospirillales bacterium]